MHLSCQKLQLAKNIFLRTGKKILNRDLMNGIGVRSKAIKGSYENDLLQQNKGGTYTRQLPIGFKLSPTPGARKKSNCELRKNAE